MGISRVRRKSGTAVVAGPKLREHAVCTVVTLETGHFNRSRVNTLLELHTRSVGPIVRWLRVARNSIGAGRVHVICHEAVRLAFKKGRAGGTAGTVGIRNASALAVGVGPFS